MSVTYGHHVLTNVALPYVSWNNAVSTDALFEKGQNVMTDKRGISLPYPGFNASVETNPTNFSNIQNIECWRTTAGTYIVMISDLAGVAKVYKYEIGVDTSAVLLFTSASANTFTFRPIEGQGWCYFGNGTEMMQYNGAALKRWGLNPPSSAPTITLASAGSFTINAAPTGAVRATNVVTITTTTPHGLAVGQKVAVAGVTDTSFNGGFTIATVPSSTKFTYAQTDVDATSGAGTVTLSNISAAIATVTRTSNVVTLVTTAAHGLSAGMSITESGVTDSSFNGSFTVSTVVDPTTITYAQVAADATSTGGTIIVSSLTAYAGGYFYYMTGVDDTQYTPYASRFHESSVGKISPCTGNIVAKQITVGWAVADFDSYCNKVRIYRTTDGGGNDPTEMALVATVDIGNLAYTDTTLDDNLDPVTFAPALYRNDPPPPANVGATFGGRIYLYSGNSMYYTGREEISNGVQFECVPGSTQFTNPVSDGNREYFNAQITAIAPRSTGVAVFTRREIWAWDGSTLDTMYPYLLLERRGAVNRASVVGLGNSVVWFDTANQYWMDGAEISVPIRPDLQSISQATVSATVHISGVYHWNILCDGASGTLFTYDLDQGQWFVPRLCGATFIWSGNTSDSNVDLIIARNGTKLLKMTPGQNKDDGADYSAYLITNLFDLSPEQQPTEAGDPSHMSVETNNAIPDRCSILIDDDPDFGTYQTLSTSQNAPNRVPGGSLKETWFMAHPDPNAYRGRRVSYRLDWNKCSTNWTLYSIDCAVYPLVGQ